MKKFKQTQIGRIPEEWEVVKLGEVAEINMGQSPPSSAYNEKGDGIPFLQGKSEFGYIYPIPKKYTTQFFKIAEENDILISVRAPVGDVNLCPFKLCIGRGLGSIRIKNNDYLFYFYYLRKIKKLIENIGKGSTFKAINKDELTNLKIPLPPIPEQKAIVEILSTADDAIQKSNEIISQTRNLKNGLMQELLTKGIMHTEFKDSEIGRIPGDWELLELKDIGEFKYGYTATSKKKDAGIKFLRITDIKSDGTIDWENLPECEITDVDYKKYKLRVGDVLFARIGATAGKTCYIDRDIKGVFASYLIRFQTKENIVSKFVYFYTQSRIYWSQALRQREGQLKKGMNANVISHLKIPVPNTVEEQHKIASILSIIDKKLELEKSRKQKLERIRQGLMNDLLTGNRRVNV